MSSRMTIPDGQPDAPVLDGIAFARLLAILADRGAYPELPGAVEARGEPVPLAVIDTPEVFATSPLLRPQFARPTPALRSRTVSFIAAAPSEVMIDLGDGTGARTMAPGHTATAEFPAAPEALMTVSRDGRTARCRVAFDDRPAPMPAETFTVPGATGWVLLAQGHAALRCPLVVVEGFPGGHGFLYSHDLLAQHGLLDSLQALGHDLVVIGLEDGARSLTDNASVVRGALAHVAEQTELPITLLGWSMGGLLARLAVAAMEKDVVAHGVETLVTWDTPHRGTMTQLGVQWFVQHFAGKHPALEMQRRLLASPANREMDMAVVGGNGAAEVDPAREALVSSLSWPQQPRRILLASGRGDGRPSLQPGQVLLHWHSADHGEIFLRALGGPEPVAAGSLGDQTPPPLEVSGLPSWDGMPGGREAYGAEVAALLIDLVGGRVTPAHPPATCTVPTVSALDLDAAPDTPVPAHDGLIACATDQPHVVMDAQATGRLRAEIGAPFDPDRFDPHDSAFLADPFPTYARFRESAPLHLVPAYESLWCFRAEECQAILEATDTWLKHPHGAVPPPVGPMSALATLPPGLFSSDPPAHPALRTAVEGPLRAALAPVPEMARRYAEQLLAKLGASERIELVQDYALPVPANVLFDLLGIDQDPILRQTLVAWQQAVTMAHDVTQSASVRLQGATCAMALRGFFGGLVKSHREVPVRGLIGTLCDTFGAAGLSDAELEGTLCDLLVAGYLSTTFIIATGVWRLLGAPEALEGLRADPGSCTAAVDELLRLDGPVQVIDRFASRATTLGGQPIAAGTKATAVVGSADRDPACFDAPDEVRIDRLGEHLAFGAGVHRCVGAPLARLVAPAALQALLEFAPRIVLDGEPQWQTDPYLRAAISLPLTLEHS